jgi:hypothetical protein
MAIDDLPLRGASSDEGPGRGPDRPSSWIRLVLVGLAGVAAGTLLTFWWLSRSRPDPAMPAPTSATDVAIASNRPKRQPIELPRLDASDTLLRELVSALSQHPTLARLLATKDLVRGATSAVVQIGDGRTPSTPLAVLRPAARLQIQGTSSGKIDPASYARWDGPVAALVSIDPAQAAQLYVNVKPLFDEAFQQLGHPGGNFDDAVVQAIAVLQATPTVTDDPLLLRRPGYFEYDDPALKSIKPVQKQFLLIGPANREKVLRWLRQIATNLDLKVR